MKSKISCEKTNDTQKYAKFGNMLSGHLSKDNAVMKFFRTIYVRDVGTCLRVGRATPKMGEGTEDRTFKKKPLF